MILALGGAMIGLALALLITPLLPVRPKLADAMGRLTADPALVDEPLADDRRARLGRWVEMKIGGVPWLGGLPRAELALLGRSTTELYYRKALLAAALFLAGIALGLYAVVLGWDPALPLLLSVPLAVLGWVLPDRDVRAEAKQARVQYARAVSVYVELVAAERRRNAHVSEAMRRSAEVSDTWLFKQIRQELTRARYDQQEPWAGLEGLGHRLGVPSLTETARVLRLSGSEGAAVYSSLRGLGNSMRVELLAEEQTRSHKITEKLGMTITMLAGSFVVLVIIPAVISLMG